MAGTSVLAKMAVQISANNAQFATALSKSQRDLSAFKSGVLKIAGALGVAFGIQQVASFALEVSKLAGEAEAVRAAFERLPNSTKLMNDLKEATGGTVSELGLMKRAVQASNFDISLAALPKLLEFATLRAQQTGQSVDYLVDSIVTGIGRKSKLILDNLGISAVQLNEALGDTAIGAASIGQVADAVGKIIDKNLENMNTFMDNNATKLQRLGASWENYKVAVGEAANETGLLGGAIDGISGTLDLLSTRDLTFFEKLKAFLSGPSGAAGAAAEAIRRNYERVEKEQRQLLFVAKQVDEAFIKFKGNIDEFAKAISPDHPLRGKFLEEFQRRIVDANKVEIETLDSLKAKQKELIAQFDKETSVANTAELKQIGLKIQAYQKEIEKLEALKRLEKERSEKPKELKMVFTPDLEAEGSLNPELRNDQARNQALDFARALDQVATSAAFAGGAVLKLEEATGGVQVAMKEFMDDIGPSVSGFVTDFAIGLGASAEGMEDFGVNIMHSVAGFMQQFGASLIALGIGKISLEKFGGPGMIAAGIALAALGGSLSASAARKTQEIANAKNAPIGTGASRFTANTSVQDSVPQLVTVLKGEDVWIMLQNYQSGNRYTSG